MLVAEVTATDKRKMRPRSPSSAECPWQSDADIRYIGEGGFFITSYVDANNALGTKVGTDFACRVQHDNGNRWELKFLDME